VHQTICDPGHVDAANVLRHNRIGLVRPPVQIRCLDDYDTLLGITGDHPGDAVDVGGVMSTKTTTSRDVSAEVAFLTRTLKAPRCGSRWTIPRHGQGVRPAGGCCMHWVSYRLVREAPNGSR
jgi:hypothetical protein